VIEVAREKQREKQLIREGEEPGEWDGEVRWAGELCVLRPAFSTLRSAFCVLRSAFCVLRSASCVLRSASCVLRPASCVLRPAFCVLRPASCITCDVSFVLGSVMDHGQWVEGSSSADTAAIHPETSPRCKECKSLEIDHQFLKVGLGSGLDRRRVTTHCTLHATCRLGAS
jgi:hypothetical protein